MQIAVAKLQKGDTVAVRFGSSTGPFKVIAHGWNNGVVIVDFENVVTGLKNTGSFLPTETVTVVELVG